MGSDDLRGDSPSPSDTASSDAPSQESSNSSSGTVISRYRRRRNQFIEEMPGGRLLWDVMRILAGVVLFSGILFMLTGLGTPFVSVMSGSMEPHIQTGDMVVITAYDTDDPPPLASGDGIVTVAEADESQTSFNRQGTVIVFESSSSPMPVIHRAHLEVEKGENWVADADPALLRSVESCADTVTCPADRDGYITAGDNNGYYDQVAGSPIVTDENVLGIAQYRIPFLGWLRNGIEVLFTVPVGPPVLPG